LYYNLVFITSNKPFAILEAIKQCNGPIFCECTIRNIFVAEMYLSVLNIIKESFNILQFDGCVIF